MGLSDKIFEAMRSGLVMNDKLVSLAEKVNRMDVGLRDVDRRLVRVETTLDIYTRGSASTVSNPGKPKIPHKKRDK